MLLCGGPNLIGGSLHFKFPKARFPGDLFTWLLAAVSKIFSGAGSALK
jgi:hypothetical protein